MCLGFMTFWEQSENSAVHEQRSCASFISTGLIIVSSLMTYWSQDPLPYAICSPSNSHLPSSKQLSYVTAHAELLKWWAQHRNQIRNDEKKKKKKNLLNWVSSLRFRQLLKLHSIWKIKDSFFLGITVNNKKWIKSHLSVTRCRKFNYKGWKLCRD